MRLAAPALIALLSLSPTTAAAQADVPNAAARAAAGKQDVRLAEAAMKRDTAAVRKLLDQKVDVNAPGRDGTPALHWLVRVDDLETSRLLSAPAPTPHARIATASRRCTSRARTATRR